MGKDYYNILKVNRNGSDEDLKRSYKRLAMIWHPEKNPTEPRSKAEAKFKQISEAYDVLSDPQKRQIYYLYGEEALKSGQFPPPPPLPQVPVSLNASMVTGDIITRGNNSTLLSDSSLGTPMTFMRRYSGLRTVALEMTAVVGLAGSILEVL